LARGAPDFVGVLVVNDGLQISEKGQVLVKSFENCLTAVNAAKTEFKPYYCPAHVLTIGWGHTNDNGRKFKEGDIWTKGECDAEFRADMRKFETAVKPPGQGRADAVAVRCARVVHLQLRRRQSGALRFAAEGQRERLRWRGR
jgi:hypothetical protein